MKEQLDQTRGRHHGPLYSLRGSFSKDSDIHPK
jgi:hypothetical protein